MIDDGHEPYLNYVGIYGSIEMYELFLDCIFHFGEILLNEKEKKPKNYNVECYKNYDPDDKSTHHYCIATHKLFIQKYFNFSLGDYPCISQYSFVSYIYNIFLLYVAYLYLLFLSVLVLLHQWGLKMKPDDGKSSSMIDIHRIMCSTYFDGITHDYNVSYIFNFLRQYII